MGKYRKVDPRIWNDEKFVGMSDKGKLVFFMLLTHPNMTALGAMRATIPGLAAEIGWPEKAFREAFGEAFAKAMVKHDEKASLIVLPNFLKYNRPESPNVVKAWETSLDLLPECRLKDELIQHVKAFAEALSKGFTKALPEAFAKTIPKAMPIQEQEQEQKKISRSKTNGEYTAAFEEAWDKYPKRAGPNSKKDAFAAWKARLRQGATEAELIAGVEAYARYIRDEGKEGTSFVKLTATFFGPGDHFRESYVGTAAGTLDWMRDAL